MRFVPNLIPEKYKVLKDYFKGTPYEPSEPNPATAILSWVLGIFFFIAAIGSLLHPLLALMLGILGFILTPFGNKYIEGALHFSLTTKIKSIFSIMFLLGMLPVYSYYNDIDVKKADALNLKTKQEEKIKVENERIEQERKDSLNFHFENGNKLLEVNKTEEAIKEFNHSLKFATLEPEQNKIYKILNSISAQKTLSFVKEGKYQKALPELDDLITHDKNNPILLYNRALCLSKVGKIKEAVDDCKNAIQLGNTDAEKLHNKINPIRKRVAYYVTRCCDGSTSNATGRGACSHHGGVCNWQEPVYEEYRQYE